jgi:hypothetical protein
MLILTGVFDFPASSGSGPRSMGTTFTVARRVAQASAVLTGYTAEYVTGDHEFGRLTVTLQTDIVSNSATGAEISVTAFYGLRDFSGNWDDTYRGQVRFALLVEFASRIIEPPIALARRRSRPDKGSGGAAASASAAPSRRSRRRGRRASRSR